MAKKKKTEEWQYEYLFEDRRFWITEDDRHSAEYKAKYSVVSTGRIRSRKVTVKKTKWKVEG